MTGRGPDDWRVSLSPLDACDPPGEVAWLPEAWSAIDGRRFDTPAPTTVAGLIDAVKLRWHKARIDRIDIAPDVFAGFIVWEETPSEIVIRGLAIRRDRRDLGYGAEAVERLEVSRPARRFSAAIPRSNGLAVYFWLRVGFRPIREDEDRERSHDQDCLWMLRSAPTNVSGAMPDP